MISWTARATAEFGTSTIACTPSLIHCRAIAAPTSGLFWWSAEISCTGRPATAAPASATAIRAASTEPDPVLSDATLAMSVSTPILIGAAWARGPARAPGGGGGQAQNLASSHGARPSSRG